MMNNLQHKSKKFFSRDDYHDDLEGKAHIELSMDMLKQFGKDNPHIYLWNSFNVYYKYEENNSALLICFPKLLEGGTTQWYGKV